jgi:hypothetical protein
VISPSLAQYPALCVYPFKIDQSGYNHDAAHARPNKCHSDTTELSTVSYYHVADGALDPASLFIVL